MRKKYILILLLIFLIICGTLYYFQYSSTKNIENLYIPYGYDLLDDFQKELYDFMEERKLNLGEEYYFDEAKDYNYIHTVQELYRANNGELCNIYCYAEIYKDQSGQFVPEGAILGIKAVQVLFPLNDFETKFNEIEKMADKIITEIPNDYTEYQKVKFIHDKLIDLIEYDWESYNLSTNEYLEKYGHYTYANTSYGGLIKNKALCEGYALSFAFISKKIGIDSIVVFGEVAPKYMPESIGFHAWNKVKIDDKWYNVDLTWNDNETNRYRFFLKSDEEFSNLRINNIYQQYSYGINVPEAIESYKN